MRTGPHAAVPKAHGEPMDYVNFDLELLRTETGYRAKVVDSPAGQGTHDFALPFSPVEIENLILRMGIVRGPMRGADSPRMEAARTFGDQLFQSVFGGAVRRCLLDSLAESQRGGCGLRLRLRMGHASELIDLPWEFLYDTSASRFLTLSMATPVVRFIEMPGRLLPLAVEFPLHVLAVIAGPTDYPALDVEAEWGKVQKALAPLIDRGAVQLHRLADPSLIGLQKYLRRVDVHVLHFVGHGDFDSASSTGTLIFTDEHSRGRPVGGQELGTLLYDEKSIRLAVLNACEGARTSRSDPFAGVAQSLVQQGIPAVIAMQFQISDPAAIELSSSFYAALADGYPVDAALGEARKALFAQHNSTEWGTPVLYLRAADGVIFDVQKMGAESTASAPAVPRLAPTADNLPSPIWRATRVMWAAGGLILLLLLALILPRLLQTPDDEPIAQRAPVTFDFAPDQDSWQGDTPDWTVVEVDPGQYALQATTQKIDGSSSAPHDTDLFQNWQDLDLRMQIRIVAAGLPNDELPDLWISILHDPNRTLGCQGYNFALAIAGREAQLSPMSGMDCPWASLATNSVNLETGEWYALRMTAEDNRLGLWIDNQLVLDAVDEHSDRGFFFLNVGTGATVQFREVWATQLD